MTYSMKKNVLKLFSFVLMLMLLVSCGGKKEAEKDTAAPVETKNEASVETKKTIVATTTMLGDLTKNIVKDEMEVNVLMKAGVDPHLYKATAGDLKAMESADMIIYGGLHLEGKLGDVFEEMASKGKPVVDSSQDIPRDTLLPFEGSEGDPHIWFDVANWKIVTETLTNNIIAMDPDNAETYTQNKEAYLLELDELQEYLDTKIAELPVEQRILVTAHDAFEYFARANDFKVESLQGISTEAEAGTKDIKELADYIIEHKVKAIFIESSVPVKNVEALQEAVKARGFEVKIGGELYSDSLGDEGTDAETYVGTLKANADLIVDSLK